MPGPYLIDAFRLNQKDISKVFSIKQRRHKLEFPVAEVCIKYVEKSCGMYCMAHSDLNCVWKMYNLSLCDFSAVLFRVDT